MDVVSRCSTVLRYIATLEGTSSRSCCTRMLRIRLLLSETVFITPKIAGKSHLKEKKVPAHMLNNTTTSSTTTTVGEVVKKEADTMLQLYLPDDRLKQVLIFHIIW